jgi:exonuclease SbcC
LAETVRNWLPTVTSGRYVDARVDPESLAVKVRAKGGSWRDAARLSHGTAEQIYLLLRIAIAEHLTKLGETCPLILDDVTAQSDEERTTAVLGMLHRISETRQVILFSQEREVLEWAQENLRGPQDSLVVLDREVVGA